MTAAREAEIRKAMAMWQAWVDSEERAETKGWFARPGTGRAVIRSFELELATGKPHCVCCLKPL